MNKNLISCNDCGREVSKNAAACPNCGKKLKTSAANMLAGVVLSIGVLFLALFVFGSAIKSFNFSTEQPKSEVRGGVFVSANGQNLPLETVLVRFYAPEKIKGMTDEEIELVAPDAMVSTSSDGKFVTKVPRGEYTVIADASRAVDKQIVYFHWKLPLSVLSEKTELVLNDQNILNQ